MKGADADVPPRPDGPAARGGSVGKPAAGPVLRLERLSKRYGTVLAVDGVDAEIREGELLSFVGPSGCGKTTLLRMAGGFARPDAGRVRLDGRDVTRDPPNRRATAMVFQSYALFPHLTVAGNVGYALRVRGRPSPEIAARVDELLRLEGLGGRRPDELSGGQQQRVALARALSVRPRVLLLDEPLSNLDAHLRLLMREEIKRLQHELGLTVAYVTHDQEEAMAISDRIAVMRAGRIEQVGAPMEIYERPATEFVARFVGAGTFLDGEVADVAGGGLAVRTPLGIVVVRETPAGLTAGARVRLVVRPEAVRLTPGDPAAGAPGVPAKIVATAYTGPVVRYVVEVGGTRLIADVHDPCHAPRFADGDRVSLELPPDAAVLPGGAGD
jgi:putative spermidine/putrescine transport system ATP-binding protein